MERLMQTPKQTRDDLAAALAALRFVVEVK
jgi:hypothetical protein